MDVENHCTRPLVACLATNYCMPKIICVSAPLVYLPQKFAVGLGPILVEFPSTKIPSNYEEHFWWVVIHDYRKHRE